MAQTLMPSVKFFGFSNKAHRVAADKALSVCDNVWPWWVHEIRVFKGENNSDVQAQTTVEQEYRSVRIDLFPEFFDLEEDEQAEVMIHESLHAVVAPITVWVIQRLIDPMEQSNNELHTVLSQEFTARFEGVVEDLAIKLVGNRNVGERA